MCVYVINVFSFQLLGRSGRDNCFGFEITNNIMMNSTTEMMTTVSNDVNSSNMTSSDDDGGVDPRVASIKAILSDCYFYSMGVVIPTGS